MKPAPKRIDGMNADRRDFLKVSAGAAGTFVAASAFANPNSSGSDVIRVGLVGCGGRGTGAAGHALEADPGVKIVALADAFEDRLEKSRQSLQSKDSARATVADDHCFVGIDGYKALLQSGVDVVLLAAPPHFRPAHLKAAIEAGKHVFAEKPVAVDAPGCRSILESVEQAKQKKLNVVSGLCYRYHEGMRELMDRLHNGAIGDMVALNVIYNTGYLTEYPRQPAWSDMEWQIRNWQYFYWLNGDHIVEQHIHSLDKAAWAMKNEYPVRAFGTGGRQQRTDAKYGNVFDHHAICYEFASGLKCFSYCRQQEQVMKKTADYYYGTKGSAQSIGPTTLAINGPQEWKFRSQRGHAPNMHLREIQELMAAVRSGNPINDGVNMTKSTLMAIMGRMASYTGQEITWEMATNSKEDFTPSSYAFGPHPVAAVPVPGVTKFV